MCAVHNTCSRVARLRRRSQAGDMGLAGTRSLVFTIGMPRLCPVCTPSWHCFLPLAVTIFVTRVVNTYGMCYVLTAHINRNSSGRTYTGLVGPQHSARTRECHRKTTPSMVAVVRNWAYPPCAGCISNDYSNCLYLVVRVI
jgi:hypothetical protein